LHSFSFAAASGPAAEPASVCILILSGFSASKHHNMRGNPSPRQPLRANAGTNGGKEVVLRRTVVYSGSMGTREIVSLATESFRKSIEDIETPALILDLDLLEENIRVMAEFFKGRKARLRPHFKTCKCPNVAHLQLAAGAKGITCAKAGEAEVLVNAGVRDILVANQVVDTDKIYRLACMARAGTKITVAVDRVENVDSLSAVARAVGSTLYVLVEIDVGMSRCGVGSEKEALELALRIGRAGGLVFEGIQAYEGHLVYDTLQPTRLTDAVKREGVRKMEEKVGGIKKYLEAHRIPVKEISGGGTGTYHITGDDTIWTEIQAGSYVFMDNVYSRAGLPFRNSLSVLTTVIHKRSGAAVTDAGLKVCTIDHGLPSIKDRPELKITGLSEEHGLISDPQDELQYLQKIEYIPSHCCTTVNLHDQYCCVRGGWLEAVWPISGRGKSL
jgi:D-serine deaminase-like pyridoxal phosphate-dependent protein